MSGERRWETILPQLLSNTSEVMTVGQYLKSANNLWFSIEKVGYDKQWPILNVTLNLKLQIAIFPPSCWLAFITLRQLPLLRQTKELHFSSLRRNFAQRGWLWDKQRHRQQQRFPLFVPDPSQPTILVLFSFESFFGISDDREQKTENKGIFAYSLSAPNNWPNETNAALLIYSIIFYSG